LKNLKNKKDLMFLAIAIQNLQPDASFIVEDNSYDSIIWRSQGLAIPSKEEVMTEVDRLKSLEPLRQLRIQRNQLLALTDWRMTEDYPFNDKEAWKTYRQALRDLPANSFPELDEFGNLTNITWPEEPA